MCIRDRYQRRVRGLGARCMMNPMDLGGMANPSGMDPKAAKEMQEMWKMLDKMSSEDPDAYKKLISEQMEEGNKQMKDQKAQAEADVNPKVWRIVKSKGELGRQVVVLLREHAKVEVPSWGEDRVPVWISDCKSGADDNGSRVYVYDAVFHPNVKARAASDKNIQRALICLALDSVSQTHGTVIELKGWKVLKKADSTAVLALPFSWQTNSNNGGSYGEEPPSKEAEKSDIFGASPLLSELSSVANPAGSTKPGQAPAEKKPAAPVLIEVMSETPSDVSTPEHQVVTDDASAVSLRVWLPGVMSVADVDLDYSEGSNPTRVCVEVEGQYELEVDLPGQLDTDSLGAKFDTATCLLTLRIPTSN
eukprot:TRINITY_DN3846_c0_g1_i10.p1 TRINITY_DN3846_c0_g1~~TRINITY_DN3846_c0_g1_i10.p1  ORF type:complete len:363 (+),score=102.89 TRINITY_DN3846_c0_g1_i10:145-1233(+)